MTLEALKARWRESQIGSMGAITYEARKQCADELDATQRELVAEVKALSDQYGLVGRDAVLRLIGEPK